jgi:hypothetical protein
MTTCTLLYATATVKARSVWTCPKCGKTEQGSTVTITVEDDKIGTPRLIFDQGAARNTSNHYMPVGWASYGVGKVLCGDCSE